MYDEHYDDYARDQWFEELSQEIAADANRDFQRDRLRSFYLAHPDLAKPAFSALDESLVVRNSSDSAVVVFATTAVELAYKAILLRPIVVGLVHSEAFADYIVDLVLGNQAIDRYRDLLFAIMREYAGIEMRKFTRQSTASLFWEELKRNQNVRNGIVHRGDRATADEAAVASALARTMLDELVPKVLTSLDLHIHEDHRICGDYHPPPELVELVSRLSNKSSGGSEPVV